jgi:hypothetical protein
MMMRVGIALQVHDPCMPHGNARWVNMACIIDIRVLCLDIVQLTGFSDAVHLYKKSANI